MEQIREETLTDEGFIKPAEFSLVDTISGGLFDEFVKNMVE